MNARGGGKTQTWLALRPSFPSSSFHTKKSTSFNSMDPYPLLSFPSSQDFPLFPRRFFFKKERKGFSSLPLTNAKLALAKVFLYFFWCLLPPHPPLEATSKQKERERRKSYVSNFLRFATPLPRSSARAHRQGRREKRQIQKQCHFSEILPSQERGGGRRRGGK